MKTKIEILKEYLPKGLMAWCYRCNGFVPTNCKHSRMTVELVTKIEPGSVSIEKLKDKIESFSYCKHCGDEVDPRYIPSVGVDRLRFVAEIIDSLEGD